MIPDFSRYQSNKDEAAYREAFGSLRRAVTADLSPLTATATARASVASGKEESQRRGSTVDEQSGTICGDPQPTHPILKDASIGSRRCRLGGGAGPAGGPGEWLLAFSVRNRLLKSLSLHTGCSSAAAHGSTETSLSPGNGWRGPSGPGRGLPISPNRTNPMRSDLVKVSGRAGPGRRTTGSPGRIKSEYCSKALNRTLSGGDHLQLLRTQQLPPRRSHSYLFYWEVT